MTFAMITDLVALAVAATLLGIRASRPGPGSDARALHEAADGC